MSALSYFISNHAVSIRIGFFFGVFILIALWELYAPRRKPAAGKPVRWLNNLVLVALNSFILRLIFPAAAIGVALFASQQGWGIFNYYSLPIALSIILSVIVMDLVIYLQHIMVHAIPVLWRLHQVHHADPDYDVTTGARFHPVEIIISMLIKFTAILILGAPVVAVVIFEVTLNAMAMFNHGNIRLPKLLDSLLRLIVVTPDMHRIHHSIEVDEANSNFGFNLSCWDHLFGTYLDQPRSGHEDMIIGTREFSDEKQTTWLTGMLVMPFIKLKNKRRKNIIHHHELKSHNQINES
jgi:sterol desaturase/sphingolipid hydroxylase (fatty acid hydroxylase superfamily)